MRKNYNKILLEAINRGIKFALDDFDNDELIGQQTQTIKDQNITKDYIEWQTLIQYIKDINVEKVNADTIRRLAYLSKKFGYKYPILNGNRDILKALINWLCNIDIYADLNWIDVSQVKDMSFLFSNNDVSKNFKRHEFNGDISEWDVSNVENMTAMFSNSKFNGDISKWNVSKVSSMRSMFAKSDFNKSINNWDVRNVKNMSYMFYGSKFNQPLDKWMPINVQTNDCMFEDTNFYQNISSWKFEHLLNSENIFYNCKNNGRNFPKEYIPRQMKSYWPNEFIGINKW